MHELPGGSAWGAAPGPPAATPALPFPFGGGGMGGGSEGLLRGSGGKDFGEQLKSGVEGGRKNAFLLR